MCDILVIYDFILYMTNINEFVEREKPQSLIFISVT